MLKSKKNNKIVSFRKKARMKRLMEFFREMFFGDPDSNDDAEYLDYEDFLDRIHW